MTSKERMLIALARGKPDRLPVTIHQWQAYHLNHYMNNVDQLEAFRTVGLDASVTPWDVYDPVASANWRMTEEDAGRQADAILKRVRYRTPAGELTATTASDSYTTYHVEHLIKTLDDAELFLKYWPGVTLAHDRLNAWYGRTGDDGIVRGFVEHATQPGPWQDLCELLGTQEAIMWAFDEADFVHQFLQACTNRRVAYVHEQMRGAKYDLIEHGGGAASSTVISPTMFDEFCAPYDKQIIDALHEEGFPVVYHTCGGMMAILDHIPHNGCDASETLSPPGMGGDIQAHQRAIVKNRLGGRVALIGGIDQGGILTQGTPEQVTREVEHCFATFGQGGGYICSACDHFFDAPVENLKALAAVGAACRYY